VSTRNIFYFINHVIRLPILPVQVEAMVLQFGSCQNIVGAETDLSRRSILACDAGIHADAQCHPATKLDSTMDRTPNLD
jgi:hypothetical protein